MIKSRSLIPWRFACLVLYAVFSILLSYLVSMAGYKILIYVCLDLFSNCKVST